MLEKKNERLFIGASLLLLGFVLLIAANSINIKSIYLYMDSNRQYDNYLSMSNVNQEAKIAGASELPYSSISLQETVDESFALKDRGMLFGYASVVVSGLAIMALLTSFVLLYNLSKRKS